MEDNYKTQALQKYNDNVVWLRQNVPMDDVYEFTEQVLMCAESFLNKLNEKTDLYQEMEDDYAFSTWVNNIAQIRHYCRTREPGQIIVSDIQFLDEE